MDIMLNPYEWSDVAAIIVGAGAFLAGMGALILKRD